MKLTAPGIFSTTSQNLLTMEENTIIEGERYYGVFAAKLRKSRRWGGSEYTEYQYDSYNYDGAGFIEDKQTGELNFFAFETDFFRELGSSSSWAQQNYSVEESIIYFNQKGPFYAGDFKPKVLSGRYKQIVDLSLVDLVSQAKQSEKQLPTVTPKRLALEKLVELGLIAGEEGQVQIAYA